MAPKSKKSATRPGSPSAAQPDPEEDESVLDQAPDAQSAAGKKKKAPKKRKAADEAEEEDVAPQQAAPPSVRKKAISKKKKGPPPPEPEEQVDEDQADEDTGDAPDIDPEIIAAAFKQHRKMYKKLPTALELATEIECDVTTAGGLIKKKKRAIEKTTNERKSAKVKGYYRGAVAAGYGDLKHTLMDRPYSMANAKGIDSLKPLLSMSDVLRLATYVPAQPKEASYDPEEFNERLGLMDTTLPVDAARELLGNADNLFKQVINRSTGVAMQVREAQYVKASHGLSWMKPFADHMMFSSLTAPAGLVAYAKSEKLLESCETDDDRKAQDKTHAHMNLQRHTAKTEELALKKSSQKVKRDRAKAARDEAQPVAA